ncbi:MAG: insulinase family protein [Gemmatimonadetes bacterium]|nr:insulinase family protein [Gemmatimonadota bacterium]
MIRTVLPGGLRVIVKTNRLSPSVAVRLVLHSGTMPDPVGKEGLANLTSSLLEDGTKKWTGDTIAEKTDFIGADFGVSVDRHATVFVSSFLREHLAFMLGLGRELLANPVFPAKEIRKVQGQILSDLREDEHDTGAVAMKNLRRFLYPRTHPYGRPASGTKKTIPALKRSDLVRFHRDEYRPSGGILMIVGDVKESEAVAAAKRAFGSWRGNGRSGPPEVPGAKGPRRIRTKAHVIAQKSQCDIALGMVGIRRLDPDFFAAIVLNQILGAFGLGGRLGNRIREQEGLAYYVYSALSPTVGPGPFVIRAGVHPSQVGRAVALMVEEIDRIRQKKVTDREIEETRRFMIDSMPLRLETNEGIAAFHLNEEYYGLGPHYLEKYRESVQAVTKEEVLAVAQRLLRPDAFGLSVAGPALPAPLEDLVGPLS